MAALAAGNTVITTASVVGVPHRKRPMAGIVQSTAPAVVDWADGTQASYVAVGSGATSVLFQVNLPPTHASLLGFVVQVPVLPNPGGRLQGVVVEHFNVLDPAGGTPGELVVIDTPVGFITVPYASVTVVASA